MANFSNPDQKARNAAAVAANDKRVLDITSVYDGSFLKGKRVLVTGGNRGLGLSLVKECLEQGAQVLITSRKPAPDVEALGVQVLVGIDVQKTESVNRLADGCIDKPLDILINSAGYFYEPEEKITSLNFDEELKMIDICALGPLRVTSALFNKGLLPPGSKVAMITSQGGSVAWRTTQNPEGHDFGHHMSKAAANMMGVLVNQELKHAGVVVSCLHPGFNKTDMTAKYKDDWEAEGAVDPSVGAKRVMHEIGRMAPENSGSFVNCEDGKLIPW